MVALDIHAVGVLARVEPGPAWLDGFVTVPFEAVAVIVGLLVLGGLVHLSRRALRDRDEEQRERERRAR